jgi:uncharacterized membrane protein YccC
MLSKIKQGIEFLEEAFQDEQFYVALRHVIGSFIPLIIGEILGFELLGLQMMLGAFFISGVDIAGTFRAKATGLCLTTVLSISITFLLLFPNGRLWAITPLLFVIIFCLAFISPYSLRYTLMAIMGYIAIILALAFSRNIHTVHATLIQCFHLLWGSAWYILYTMTIHYFVKTREINRRVALCMRQTADYFDQRLALLGSGEDHEKGLMELARLQQELNETQESVRELLFEHPSILTKRNSSQHRFFTIFVELIDMHELAVASPIDYPKIRKLLNRYPEYHIIRKIIRSVNFEMHNLADVLLQGARHRSPEQLRTYLDQLHKQLQEFGKEVSLDDIDEQEVYDTLERIEKYLHQQLQKVKKIRNTVLERSTEDGEERELSSNIAAKDIPRFISPNPLNWNSVAANLNFDSSYFRYALRTAVTAVLGYVIGFFLHVQNPYWVLLTVLLVMKPGYGATKQRFFHRIGGTIIGAVVAFGIYQGHPSHEASLAIFGLSFLLAFTFVVKNYAIASGFFTIFVIFLYSFLSRPIPISILFRVADTVLGALLVILAIFYLWPHWEHQKFSYYLRHSVQANKDYLKQVLNYLYEKTFNETDYRLSRKQAYVEMADVVSSFNRLQDEPESRRRNARPFHNLAMLNYMLLSGITSIATFLQRHPKLSLSDEQFRVLGHKTIDNLDYTLRQLKKHSASEDELSEKDDMSKSEKANEEFQQKIDSLKKNIGRQEKEDDHELYSEYANLNYLNRQLKWMHELSQSIIDHVHEAD